MAVKLLNDLLSLVGSSRRHDQVCPSMDMLWWNLLVPCAPGEEVFFFFLITSSRASKKPSSASTVQVSSSWILCQHFSVFLSKAYRGALFRKIREKGEKEIRLVVIMVLKRLELNSLSSPQKATFHECAQIFRKLIFCFSWKWVVGINTGTEHAAEKILQYHERS